MLRLAARGLTNDEIATELFVSRTTVTTHVARVPAVVHACEHGLVSGP